jgi:hypothetical protein
LDGKKSAEGTISVRSHGNEESRKTRTGMFSDSVYHSEGFEVNA